MSKNKNSNLSRAIFFSSPSNFNRLTVRPAAMFLIIALLVPVIHLSEWRKTSAASISPASQNAAPGAAPPESFIFSSNAAPGAGFLSTATISQSLVSGYRSISDALVSPELPEGFAMAKVPTVWENASSLISSIPASVSTHIAPLFFVPSPPTNAAPNAPAAPLVLPPGTTRFDFDGDGKADASRWQPSSGEWKIKQSSTNSFSITTLGASAATVAPADYDNDAKTDTAVFDSANGIWTIKRSSNGTTLTINGFGQWGDKAASGDYDGDGLADAAFWRPSNGTWYVKQSSNGTVVSVAFGASGDVPVAGNYDGDSKMDYAVFRPSTGVWHLLLSNSGYGYTSFQWGAGSDMPVPADYDGDGKTDYAVYRPQNGTWYAYQSSTNNGSYLAKAWGNYGD